MRNRWDGRHARKIFRRRSGDILRLRFTQGAPFEELNHIIQRGDYGYPDCWNEKDVPCCENTIPAVALFEAHSSADGLDFYNGEHFLKSITAMPLSPFLVPGRNLVCRLEYKEWS